MTNLCKLNEILFNHVIKMSWCKVYLNFFKVLMLVVVLFSCQMPAVKPVTSQPTIKPVEVIQDVTVDYIENWTDQWNGDTYYPWQEIAISNVIGSYYNVNGHKYTLNLYTYNRMQLTKDSIATTYYYEFKDQNTIYCYPVTFISNTLSACLIKPERRVTTFQFYYNTTLWIFGELYEKRLP